QTAYYQIMRLASDIAMEIAHSLTLDERLDTGESCQSHKTLPGIGLRYICPWRTYPKHCAAMSFSMCWATARIAASLLRRSCMQTGTSVGCRISDVRTTPARTWPRRSTHASMFVGSDMSNASLT